MQTLGQTIDTQALLASKTHEINRDVESVRSQSSLTTQKLDTRVDGALSVMNKVED